MTVVTFRKDQTGNVQDIIQDYRKDVVETIQNLLYTLNISKTISMSYENSMNTLD